MRDDLSPLEIMDFGRSVAYGMKARWSWADREDIAQDVALMYLQGQRQHFVAEVWRKYFGRYGHKAARHCEFLDDIHAGTTRQDHTSLEVEDTLRELGYVQRRGAWASPFVPAFVAGAVARAANAEVRGRMGAVLGDVQAAYGVTPAKLSRATHDIRRQLRERMAG